MKLPITLFTLLLTSSTLGAQMSKEIKLDDIQHLARHAAKFEDRLDGYNRCLYVTENEIQLTSILSEMSKLGKSKEEREVVLVTLCERYLESTALSNLPKLLWLISDLIPQYINENIDPNYKCVNDHRTTKGLMVNYKKLVNLLLPSNPIIASAMLKQGYLYLVSVQATTDAERLVSEVYDANPTNAEVAAVFCENLCWKLIKQRKYNQLLQTLDTCSVLERMEVSANYYYVRAIAHLHKNEEPQALTYARTALSFDSSPMYRKFLATMLTFNGHYDEAISHYYTVLKAGDYNDGLLELELLQALQLAGRDAEATDLLLNEFTHIRNNLERHKEPQKPSIKEEVEKKQPQFTPKRKVQEKAQPTPKTKGHSESSYDQTSSVELFSSTSPRVNLKKEILDREKERPKKEKRKGTPNPDFKQVQEGKELKTAKALPTPQVTEITVEELLGENSHHYETFYKFFSYLDDDTKLTSVHITMKQALQLLKFFGEVDRSKGKGSHTKATLSIEANSSEDEHSSEIMVILSKKSQLLPYQIRKIRNAFLELGFYPKDLKEILIKKQLLNK